MRYLILLAIAFILSACSTKSTQFETVQIEYYKTLQNQINKAPQKLVEIGRDEKGDLASITVYREKKEVVVPVPQKQYSPVWAITGRVLDRAISTAGFTLGIKEITSLVGDIAKDRQTTVYENSFNTTSGDYSLGGISNAGDTVGADMYSGDYDSSTNIAGDYSEGGIYGDYANSDNMSTADQDSSTSVSGDYTGGDYYPDSSSTTSTTSTDSSTDNQYITEPSI